MNNVFKHLFDDLIQPSIKLSLTILNWNLMTIKCGMNKFPHFEILRFLCLIFTDLVNFNYQSFTNTFRYNEVLAMTHFNLNLLNTNENGKGNDFILVFLVVGMFA